METLPETVDEPLNNLKSDLTAVERNNALNEFPEGKRPLEESAEDNENEVKKCKIDDENDKKEIKPMKSKRQMKMALKQQKWQELKEKRK